MNGTLKAVACIPIPVGTMSAVYTDDLWESTEKSNLLISCKTEVGQVILSIAKFQNTTVNTH